ncbi:MAG: acyl-CoA dehydrogenase family protein [Elainellaceae cyanobacterium]
MPQVFEKINSYADYSVAEQIADKLAETSIERDVQAGIPDYEIQMLRDSGLLKLPIPTEYGGAGANWLEAYHAIQALAKAEGSIGQLYANHVCLVRVMEPMGRPGQAEHYYRLTAEQNLFWGNALNGRDARLKITPEGNHFRVNGVKSFGTGLISADLRVIGACQDGVPAPIAFVLPKDREGIIYNNDWHNMGQRRTASGSFTFNNVLVKADELIGPPLEPEGAFATLIFVVTQLSKTYVYLGVAQGALEAAKHYTLTSARPWITSGVDQASQDPYTLHLFGELWTGLQAAIALADRAAQQVQSAWDQGTALTPQERAEVAIAVYMAKSMAVKAGLEITNRVFEGMGARATSAKYGFDRYWRDLRTFSLHDPIAYKYRYIGNWLLNQEMPMPSQYS